VAPPVPSTAAEEPSILALFSESASRVVVSVSTGSEKKFLALAESVGVPARRIGTTGGTRLEISIHGQRAVDVAVAEAEHVWATALEKYFERAVA
jgi:formate-dependent phosphoribosylglycinamide formyltransferase (GAR transformylase)